MSYDWLSILSIGLWLVVPAVIFLSKNWLLARITKGVQHEFDVKMEQLRTDLRKSEEHFKSELRDKESEITALRTNLLSGSASRQALLDKRRFDAVERVWTAVNDMAQLKNLSASMALLNFKELAKRSSDPKMQQFLGVIGTMGPQDPPRILPEMKDPSCLSWRGLTSKPTQPLSFLVLCN